MNTHHANLTYKPSNVGWLGEVPEYWEVVRLRGAVANVVDLTGESYRDDIYLALEHVESWTGRFDVTDDGVDFDGQVKRFQHGDVLFGKLRPYLAKVTCPDRGGVCAGEFLVLRPGIASLSPKYLELVLRSKPVIDAIDASTFGAKMPRADWQFIGNMRLPLPPVGEQRAIVRFLHHADRRIRCYIQAKKRLVKLLEEQKQAIIHQAVTGKIDVRTGQPYPAYKDSGVEWLGEVPEQWEKRRLKSLLRVVDRRSTTGEETLLSLRRDHGVVVYSEHFARPPQGKTLVGYKQLAVGQLVVNRLQANNGLVFCSMVDGLVSPDYSVFERKASLQMKYLSDLLRLSAYRSHFRRVSTGLGTGTAGFLRLYDDPFLATTVFLPPEDEQVAILKSLADETTKIEGLIARQQRSLQLFAEYRTRLIADAATGKLDVREAASALPEIDPLLSGDRQDGALGRNADPYLQVESALQEPHP